MSFYSICEMTRFEQTTQFWTNKNSPTVVSSLACLEIRSRNEEAINSAWNRIYLLKVFYFLLHQRRVFFWIITFYSLIDLVRVSVTTRNTSAVTGYASV